MLYVLVNYQAKPGMREKFVEAVTNAGILEKIHARAGNFQYEYFYPANGGNDSILLVERWKDEQALAEHQADEYMKQIQAYKSEYTVDVKINKIKTDSPC